MIGDSLSGRLDSPVSRRSVVRMGIKLGYAAPLIAASFKLTAEGALAVCVAPYVPVTLTTGEFCCTCATTVIGYELVVENDTARCVKAGAASFNALCVSNVSPA